MEKQTAVEWLFERITMFCMFTDGIPDEWSEAFNQAIQIEKEQIVKAHKEGNKYNGWALQHEHEQYYNETYGK